MPTWLQNAKNDRPVPPHAQWPVPPARSGRGELLPRPERSSSLRSELAYRRGSSEESVAPAGGRPSRPAGSDRGALAHGGNSPVEVDYFDEPPEAEPEFTPASEETYSPHAHRRAATPEDSPDEHEAVVAWAIGDPSDDEATYPPQAQARQVARPAAPQTPPPAVARRQQASPPTQPSLPRTPHSRSGQAAPAPRPDLPGRINSYFGPSSQPQLAVTDVRAHTERIANPHATEFLLELRFKLRINEPGRE